MALPAMGKRGLGRSRERGRKRVPLRGPPTRMTAFIMDVEIGCGRGGIVRINAHNRSTTERNAWHVEKPSKYLADTKYDILVNILYRTHNHQISLLCCIAFIKRGKKCKIIKYNIRSYFLGPESHNYSFFLDFLACAHKFLAREKSVSLPCKHRRSLCPFLFSTSFSSFFF
jgi:hypothetical protein